MRVPVTRKKVNFLPDSSRVVARYFMNGDEATKDMLKLVFVMSESEVRTALDQTLREFAYRHRNITQLFKKHFNNVLSIINQMPINIDEISNDRKLLIGSYLTMEYAIKS